MLKEEAHLWKYVVVLGLRLEDLQKGHTRRDLRFNATKSGCLGIRQLVTAPMETRLPRILVHGQNVDKRRPPPKPHFLIAYSVQRTS